MGDSTQRDLGRDVGDARDDGREPQVCPKDLRTGKKKFWGWVCEHSQCEECDKTSNDFLHFLLVLTASSSSGVNHSGDPH
jgi:hypothetical protein